jgi:Zn-dependent protease
MLVWVFASGRRGMGFTLGLVVSIYIHEMGHVAALARYGIQATAPMFIPGIGALVRLKQQPTNTREDARVGLAGPLWGLGAAIGAYLLSCAFASPLLRSITSTGASINLFNLIAVWQLDGARGMRSLSRQQRWIVCAMLLLCSVLGSSRMVWAVCAVAVWRTVTEPGDAEGDTTALKDWLLLAPSLTTLASLPVHL